MARSHSKKTVVIIDGHDISEHCNTSTEEDGQDSHDLTTYGKDRKVKGGGLGDGKFTIGGFYDTSKTEGPRAVLKPLTHSGDTVLFQYRPEGTGSGKPQTAVQVLVTKYTQSAPAADYITWSADLEESDDIDDSDQV
jgi:hypothetical protein